MTLTFEEWEEGRGGGGGHKVVTKQSLEAVLSHTFLLIGMKFDFVLKQFKFNSLNALLIQI